MSAINRKLFTAVDKAIGKKYDHRLDDYVEKRIDEEIDIIIEDNNQALFLLTKELMERTGLEAEDIIFGQGIGYRSIVSYLIGLSDMDPYDFDRFYSDEKWLKHGEDAFIEMEVPFSKYDEVMDAVQGLPDVSDVFTTDGEDPKECCLDVIMQDMKGYDIETTATIWIKGNKELDVLFDLRNMFKEQDDKCMIKSRNEALAEAVRIIKRGSCSGLETLPLIRNMDLRKAFAKKVPKNIYELADLIVDTLDEDRELYPTTLGLTKIAVDMARYKFSLPDAYFEAYLRHNVSDAIIKKTKVVGETWRDVEPGVDIEEWDDEEKSADAKKGYIELKNEIRKTIIGNDELVDALALTMTSSKGIGHLRIEENDYYPRQTLLIIGGTGTGKTFTVKTAAKASDRLFVDINLADISATGYAGKDLEAVFATKATTTTPDKWMNGIFFFDELDKVIMTEHEKSRERNFDLVPELLKLIEGETMTLMIGKEKRVEVPTRNMTFIFAGAFEEVNRTILERLDLNRRIGFDASEILDVEDRAVETDDSILSEIECLDLEKYGVSRQLLGRMNRVVVTTPMTEEGYRLILTESNDSAFLKQQHLLRDVYGIDLHISDEAIRSIASNCTRMNVGARGLNAIVNTIVSKGLAEAMDCKNKNVIGMVIVSDENGGVRCELQTNKTKRSA